MTKERRMVTLCEGTPESTGKLGGGGPRLWSFGYKTLAQLFGISEGAVRMAVYQGRLDPADLEMVCESWLRYHPHKAVSLAAQMSHPIPDLTPEEQEMIAKVRTKARSVSHPDPVEETERMKVRCKTTPNLRSGPTPADMEKAPQLSLADPELRGMVLARCAAASHEEPKTVTPAVGDNWADEICKLCKLPVGEHSGTQLSDCLDAIRELKKSQVKRVLGSPAKLDVTNDGHVIITKLEPADLS
jgi:hypothetical protein